MFGDMEGPVELSLHSFALDTFYSFVLAQISHGVGTL